MNRRSIVVSVTVLCGLVATAMAQSEQVVVAVYVPSVVVGSAQARAEFAQGLAAQLGAKMGRSARGLAFANARDLEAAVARNEVQLAVLDPLYVAGRGAARIVATARRGGSTSVVAIGVGRVTGRGLPAVRGKRLVLPAVGGMESRFIDGFVLEGEATVRDYWSSVRTAPDGASAIASVAAGQADVAVVLDSPEARAVAGQRGLSVIFTTRPLPGPALAFMRAPDPALAGSLAAAARGLGAGPLGDGWGDASDGYRGLTRVPDAPRPLFGAPAQMDFSARGVLETPASDLTLPPLEPRLLVESPERL